jgi:prepilin-type N-terminal cleavage/methylation domain-containing protein
MLEQLMARQAGFTMIELMTTMVVAGVLLVLAVPAFNDLLARRRLEGVATDLSTDLQFARTAAVTRRGTTTLRTQASGTQYVVTTAEGTKTVNLPAGIAVTDGITVTYDQFRGMADAAYTLSLTSSRTTATMNVVVNAMGRVSMCSPSGSLRGFAAC